MHATSKPAEAPTDEVAVDIFGAASTNNAQPCTSGAMRRRPSVARAVGDRLADEGCEDQRAEDDLLRDVGLGAAEAGRQVVGLLRHEEGVCRHEEKRLMNVEAIRAA
jgi:hypothetical protein